MKAVIDAEKCIGCGLCAQVAPDIFEMQGDKAIVKTAEVPAEKEEETKNATEQCPVTAILTS